LFAALRAGRHLITQQVTGRQVREAVLLYDLVALRALPTARTTYNARSHLTADERPAHKHDKYDTTTDELCMPLQREISSDAVVESDVLSDVQCPLNLVF